MRVPAYVRSAHPRAYPWVFLEYAEPNPIGGPTIPLMQRGGKGKFAQWMGGSKTSLQQRIQNKQNGVGRQRRPWVGE